MAVNRFAELLSQPAPQTSAQIPSVPVGFAVCPIFVVQLQPAQQPAQQQNPMQELYRAAYEQAQAKARLTRLEKRFFSVWN